jgi:hypothetical protein
MVHPHLRWRTYSQEEQDQALIALGAGEDGDESTTPQGQLPNAGDAEYSDDQTPLVHDWKLLPDHIRLKILKMVLVFPNEVVHVLSRLDPYPMGEDLQLIRRNARGKYKLFHKFHIGKAKCDLTHAIEPNDLLAPLLVSKQWCFVGIHLFVGLNRFAFSSLGE